jgi:hypothetical protein
MNLHSVSDALANSPAQSRSRLGKPRQTRLRRYLAWVAVTFLTLFAHKKTEGTEHDMPLGDQVQLPADFLETISRIPDTHGRN